MSSDKSSALSTVEPVLAPLKAPAVVPTGVDLYARFAFSGAVCCGVTHGALTPVDVVKTRMQLDSATYNKGMIDSTRKIIRNEGVAALATGLGPTFAGYFLQGAFKFGGYEFWKKTMIDILGVETATANRTAVYLGSAAIAEFFADIALCPLEATRIRLVSQPNFASGLASGFARLLREEGVMRGFYSGFGPILFKQIPYTMAKFAVYEKTVEVVYSVIQTPKSELAVSTNTAINLGSGLVAGLAAAVVSQPADTLLSKINKQKGTPGSVTSRLIKLAQELGPRGLFLGLGARLVMVGTLTAGQFAIYGDIKRILGATNSVELVRVTN